MKNRLINEQSPYLLQHATNPVDWFPWSDEAFVMAKREDKPVFLSIGYSTCHWCHVMAHESFENDSIAKLMNDTFISIKVDREERPDIDNIYMKVCQMMTGSGGWPLTIVMTPDKEPFFAATYIPPANRQGRAGMPDLIKAIKVAWQKDREKISETVERVIQALDQERTEPGHKIQIRALAEVTKDWFSNRFDEKNGGFGSAPKFPSPHNLIFLLRYSKFFEDKQTAEMVYKTLEKMRSGGIYDHIGFGFHRYSTDKIWKLPHFEKMLYDQAMLIFAYTEAYQKLDPVDPRRGLFHSTVEEIISYIGRDMTADSGGFYSAEDADSEGIEGKFYVWDYEEIKSILDDREIQFLTENFGVRENGNFSDEATQNSSVLNILHVTEGINELLNKNYTTSEHWENIRKKLFDFRKKRVHPGKDDKILTDWNGLAFGAIALAGRVFERSDWLAMAEANAKFLLDEMRDTNGNLIHRYKEGVKGIKGFIDDYAFVIWGMIELYASTLKVLYLKEAFALLSRANDQFWDPEKGGYFFSGSENERMISTIKDLYDGAIPSGNSVMLNNLLRLFHYSGKIEYRNQAETPVQSFNREIDQQPGAYTHLLTGLMTYDFPVRELVISGESESMTSILQKLESWTDPNLFIIWRNKENADTLAELAPFTSQQETVDELTYYLCEDHTCNLPTNDIEIIRKKII